MLLSVYATDTPAVQEAVLAQAADPTSRAASTLFTSLHMPEASDFIAWLAWMGDAHQHHGVTFWVDVSPQTFTHVGHGPEDGGYLTRHGVKGLRIDDGYTPQDIGRIAAASDLPIAVNASTITADELDATLTAMGPLRGPQLVGWHNFYPRPGTGLTEDTFVVQSRMFTERGLRTIAFVAGDSDHRAPLHLGLPTLEAHRHRNTYSCALDLDRLAPGIDVACAEGPVLQHHLSWIYTALPHATGAARNHRVLTLPLVDIAPGCDWLLADWDLRRERSAMAQRLLDTRGRDVPFGTVPADALEAGSVQMDTLGRYTGEVSLFTATAPLDGQHLRLADVGAPYRGLVNHLDRFESVRFVRQT